MKKLLISAIALVATISQASFAQTPTPEQLAQRAIERRAVEAVIWGMPAVNYDLMLQEMLTKTAGKVNQMIYWGRPLDWRNQTLTPNPDTLYFMAFFNTKDVGPIVIEIPPAGADGSLNANIVNIWQQPLEDAGLLGVDKGAGIKLLMLPPGYSDKIPDGYAALQPGTFGSYALFRSNLKSHGEADVAKSIAYGKRIKVYPLSQASAPPAVVFTDVKDVLFDSTIRYDESFFEGAQPDRAERTVARPRSGHDRSAEIARHREGQAVRSQRRDEAGSRQSESAKRRCRWRQDMTPGCPPFLRAHTGPIRRLPNSSRRQPSTLQSRTPIRSMRAALPTVTPISASSGWAPASSI